MDVKDLRFISISIGKKVKVKYEVLKEDRIYTAEDDEIPHPNFVDALKDFRADFATAFEKMENDDFNVIGISFESEKDKFFAILKGKMNNRYDESATVSSGKIPIEEDTSMSLKVTSIKEKAFKYLFEGVCAQAKIDFKEKK